MRIVHLIQPASCPAPPWPCADQRADAPCHIVAALAASSGIGTHEAIILGGSRAQRDAAACGLRAAHVAPLMGHGVLGTRPLSAALRSLSRDDIVIGWGTQFRRILDLARPRSTRIAVDLSTGVLWSRAAAGGDWEAGDPLPARLGSHANFAPAASAQITSGPISVGLCDDAPAHAPTVAFAFALGVLAATGFDVTPVLRRGVRDLSRLVRHTREGGRLLTPRLFEGPIAAQSNECNWWLCALPSRATQTDPPYAHWSTLILADVMASRGAHVLGVGDGCRWIDASLAPRIRMVEGHALSDASAGLLVALAEGAMNWSGDPTSDVCAAINNAVRRASRGESPRTWAKREKQHAS